jgi:KaiC/GvpD/RAD55 family RecA-like ATPase
MASPEQVERAQKIVERCGGYAAAVDTAMELSKQLWDFAVAEDSVRIEGRPAFLRYYRVVPEQEIISGLRHHGEGIVELLLEQIQECGLSRGRENGAVALQRVAFQPVPFVREVLGGVRADHDLRYFAMLSIRRRYQCALTAEMAHVFQGLTNALNLMISSWHGSRSESASEGGEPQPSWPYKANFVHKLSEAIRHNEREDSKRIFGAFIECCRAVNYLHLSAKPGWVSIRSGKIDSAFLISHLFGMPTGISGFDDLFGGGGIMLSESVEHSAGPRVQGRSILTVGRFGTGKSLLSLQLAAEVARKGGISWVIGFEQSSEESLFALESVCALPDNGTVTVARTNAEATQLLMKRREGTGAIVFLKTGGEGLEEFVEDFSNTVGSMLKYQSYALRLVIVDPVNAITRQAPVGTLRRQTFRMLEEAKASGINVWLIAEEATSDDSTSEVYEQYIADTVIHLFLEERSGYSQRYFQISKSRFQREQRGKHAFSIVPGEGFSIFPSAAAVSARIRPRAIRAPSTRIRFGLPSLDAILGSNSLHAGDVIVLQGPSGCFKTPVGLSFLFSGDETASDLASTKKTSSLLVAARDNLATISDTLKRHKAYHRPATRSKARELRIASAESGYVKPGQIFQQIEKELISARLRRRSIDRVVVDNIEHWDLSCPFIQAEPTFGDTLIDLLRRNDLTSLLICEDFTPESGSLLQRSVVANADCVIQFIRLEFGGRYHVMIRILKTRGMKHRREFFELLVGDDGVEVDTKSSLLRVTPGGGIARVKVRLILYSESRMQDEYNHSLLETIRSVLSRDAQVDSLNSTYLARALSLGFAAAVDELQVLELGEFQLSNPESSRGRDLPLHKFAMALWDDKEWKDFLPHLKRRVSHSGKFIAIPFYDNPSLLAYRDEALKNRASTESWAELAEECLTWEAAHSDISAIFFDFPANSDESFNCLFLEILLSLGDSDSDHTRCAMQACLRSDSAHRAGKLMRTLCFRAHLAHAKHQILHQRSSGAGYRPLVSKSAAVWRHWYSTLNDMMFDMPPDLRAAIHVSALPAGVSVASERYLAVPAYSEAPDLGLKIINLFTSHTAESDRLRLGVGLPTRSSFYRHVTAAKTPQISVSPYFSMDQTVLENLAANKGFRRSTFGCYTDLRGLLASHLRRIIEIPQGDETDIDREVANIFRSLTDKIEFAGINEQVCTHCQD